MDLELLLLKVSMDTISVSAYYKDNNYRFAFVADHDNLSRSAAPITLLTIYFLKQSLSENPYTWFTPALSILGNCSPDTGI
jgi:hypothetical protein